MKKIRVGILGSTGVIGQKYASILEGHPWFEITYLAASPHSAGKKYSEALKGKWRMESAIPDGLKDLVVQDANHVEKSVGKCDFIFSALEMGSEETRALENKYAEVGFPVVSNCSAHRFTPDVPMVIPEINPHHLNMIDVQRKNHGWEKGFVVVKPNCSLQSYLLPIHILRKNGYGVKNAIVTTMQAVSGAGSAGVSSLDIIDNVIPYISGEEEKSQNEPLKILGRIEGKTIVNDGAIKISAHCNRVPVIDGHLACVSIKFDDGPKIPDEDEIINMWRKFRGAPQELDLPTAPKPALVYFNEENRPQPRKDRNLSDGMAISAGRLRKCEVFDYKFVCLSHNTIRGAAGGGVLNAELLHAKKYL